MYYDLYLGLLVIFIMVATFLLLVTSNRVYSILYLIFIYLCSGILFIYLGVAFLGAFLFIVYLGAVSVLFLFSIMTLDLKDLRSERDYTLFINLFILLLLLFIQIYLFLNFNIIDFYKFEYEHLMNTTDSLRTIGFLFFYYYGIIIIFSAILLLVSMIGSIYLTHKKTGYYVSFQEEFSLYREIHINNVLIK